MALLRANQPRSEDVVGATWVRGGGWGDTPRPPLKRLGQSVRAFRQSKIFFGAFHASVPLGKAPPPPPRPTHNRPREWEGKECGEADGHCGLRRERPREGKGKGEGRGEGRLGHGGRGRSKGGEKPMGTTADGGKGSKGRAANGDRPVGAASCRRDHHTLASCQNPPRPTPPPPFKRSPGAIGEDERERMPCSSCPQPPAPPPPRGNSALSKTRRRTCLVPSFLETRPWNSSVEADVLPFRGTPPTPPSHTRRACPACPTCRFRVPVERSCEKGGSSAQAPLGLQVCRCPLGVGQRMADGARSAVSATIPFPGRRLWTGPGCM